jgi:hypothetical protein
MDNTQKAKIPTLAALPANYHHRMHLPAPRTAQRDTNQYLLNLADTVPDDRTQRLQLIVTASTLALLSRKLMTTWLAVTASRA